MCKYGVLRGFQARLVAVGQTAFSNYIAHSLIYGYQLYYVVAGLWIFSLVASPIWLRHFRFGPLEWAWRSLLLEAPAHGYRDGERFGGGRLIILPPPRVAEGR
jgi:uncharacterized membrane protein YeiB